MLRTGQNRWTGPDPTKKNKLCGPPSIIIVRWSTRSRRASGRETPVGPLDSGEAVSTWVSRLLPLFLFVVISSLVLVTGISIESPPADNSSSHLSAYVPLGFISCVP